MCVCACAWRKEGGSCVGVNGAGERAFCMDMCSLSPAATKERECSPHRRLSRERKKKKKEKMMKPEVVMQCDLCVCVHIGTPTLCAVAYMCVCVCACHRG